MKIKLENKTFQNFFDLVDIIIVSYDTEGIITEINKKGAEILGYNQDEIIGRNWFETVQLPENVETIKKKYAKIINKEIPYNEYYKQIALTKSGEKIYLSWHSTMIYDDKGCISGALCSGMDLTHLRHIEDNILTLSAAVEQSPSVVVITDLEGNIEYVNPKFTDITGYEKHEVLGKNPRILKSGYFQENIYEELWEIISTGGEWRGEFYNKKKNGDLYWESASLSSIKDRDGRIKHYLAVKEDITDRKLIEESLLKRKRELKTALVEKEALLRELHHRTKNNMQVISSMLNLSASKLDDSRVLEVFEDINNSIQSMSLVHEKLYLSDNLSGINLKEYIIELCSSLKGSYCTENCKIEFKFDLEDITVLIDAALPLGLIINELVSNSFKHAFRKTKKGEIRIVLKNESDSDVKIILSDNGMGPGSEFNIETLKTIGLQTIVSIAESQLQGSVKIDTSKGFKFILIFDNTIFTTRV